MQMNMIELTVKTLDAQNHHFTVPDTYTVEQLKDHIAETIKIPSDSQRCIYLGQVLQNDIKLSDCNVNGKVIHVVQRPPPSTAYATNTTQNSNTAAPSGRRSDTHSGTMYLGAMAFPSDFMETGGLTFLHPRSNLSVSRLVVARNLLTRAASIINQLEHENYFSSTQTQNPLLQSQQTGTNLVEDINNTENNNSLEQPEVEIRIELSSNSQPNLESETAAGTEDSGEIQDSETLNSETPSASQQADETSNIGSSSTNQQETENASSETNREEAGRRRSSRTPMMATVMGAVLHAQVRLIPFMRLLRQYLLQDTAFGPDVHTTHTEQQIQSLYNSVSELMHYFSHIYHALSDIMCDFSQPPPRTLRFRPVILQQQHSVIRSGPRGSRIIARSPVVAVGRSASSAPPSATTDTANNTSIPNVVAETATVTLNDDIGSSVEVVIEEADTTNLQENNDEGLTENMDTSEPNVPATDGEDAGEQNGASISASVGNSTVTVRGRSGNTYVIQSMPDGFVPEGIRINSVETTILTPSDDIAAAIASGGAVGGGEVGGNERLRAGMLPAEVLQGMFGFINQFRQSHRHPRGSTGERTRPSSNSANAGDNQTPTNSSETNNSNQQTQNGPNERSFEMNVSGLSRTFDPFLPCHSHHISTYAPRRSLGTMRSTATQASSSNPNQSEESSQTTQSTSQQSGNRQSTPESQSQSSQAETQSQSEQSPRGNENDARFSIPEMPRNVTNFFNSVFSGLNIGNVVLRRSSSQDANNTNSDNGDTNNAERQTARARIQLSSNLNAIFPGAIQIEIDPMTNHVQTNMMPNFNMETNEPRSRSRRTRTACRRPRANAMSNSGSNAATAPSNTAASDETKPRTANASSSSSSPSSSSSSSSSTSDDEFLENLACQKRKTKKEKEDESGACKTIKNLYSVMKREAIRQLTEKKEKNLNTNDLNSHHPLYAENQENLFMDIVNSVVTNPSFEQMIRGNDHHISELTLSFTRGIHNRLIECCNIKKDDKQSLLNAVNILINNELFKMKNILDSESIKQEIDLVSTLCKFNQDSVPELIELIVNSTYLNKKESKKFSQIFHFYIARLLTLFMYCISGEDKSINIKKVLGSVIEEVIKNTPQDEELTRWLRKELINHVISYSKINAPNNLPSFMKHYVVYRLPPIIPVECTVATATLTNFKANDHQTVEQSQPMEIEEVVQSTSSTSSEASFVSLISDEPQPDYEPANNDDNTNANGNEPEIIPVIPTAEELPGVVLNPEEWHSSFPSEWVPIIARDIHRLRRQGSQPPFSDAYLSGMPTKRRKLIKNSKPDLHASDQLISGNISSAIDSAGFSASLNAIANRVTETINPAEGTLNDIVKEELKENVRENVVQQADFVPHRFPDSAKYFMDK